MLPVWQLAVQVDGCICCRILMSSFYDWPDFMEEMMKGTTVDTISYCISCPLYTLTVLDYLSISVLSLTKMAYLLTNVLSLVGDGQLLMCVLDHWQNVYLCLWTQPVKLKPLWKSTVCFKAEKHGKLARWWTLWKGNCYHFYWYEFCLVFVANKANDTQGPSLIYIWIALCSKDSYNFKEFL